MEKSDLAPIAVIDDDESVRESVVSLVESVGYDAILFGSAEEFLQSPYINRITCMILDVRLPGMSGFELHSRVRANKRRINTIFITAHIDDAARAWAMEAGAVAFLYKPFQARVLLDVLRVAAAEARA